MSADEGSEYDDEQQDQEEIMIDNEVDGQEARMDAEDQGVEDQPRMRISQVPLAYHRKSGTTPAQRTPSTAKTTPLGTSCATPSSRTQR